MVKNGLVHTPEHFKAYEEIVGSCSEDCIELEGTSYFLVIQAEIENTLGMRLLRSPLVLGIGLKTAGRLSDSQEAYEELVALRSSIWKEPREEELWSL